MRRERNRPNHAEAHLDGQKLLADQTGFELTPRAPGGDPAQPEFFTGGLSQPDATDGESVFWTVRFACGVGASI